MARSVKDLNGNVFPAESVIELPPAGHTRLFNVMIRCSSCGYSVYPFEADVYDGRALCDDCIRNICNGG